MKNAIICYHCKKLTRFSNSYAMRVRLYYDTATTHTSEEIKLKVRVCKQCARSAGYKVKSRKISRKKILKDLGLRSEKVQGTLIQEKKA